jgi:hypothetical protein
MFFAKTWLELCSRLRGRVTLKKNGEDKNKKGIEGQMRNHQQRLREIGEAMEKNNGRH